ncbi:Rhophilin, Rho GTPase binding protein [Entophlyctis sp. JEL0112]|nr:Rhophilin, Rho GTPase binding protein [Entophlyctis sp. JEL0112]
MHLSPRTPVLGATDFAVIAAAAVSTSSASPLSVAFTTSAAATDLDALTTIRRQALASDAPLSELCRYLEALSAAADKLPPVLARAVPFTWASSATVTSTSPQSAFTSFDLEFEKASVLFNIATSLRTSAFAEHAVDHKSACNTLCMAAAAFRQAHELGFVCSTACVDFASATCSALESVCVAEAQERFVKKAEADKLSIATLAKLAFGAARLYVGAHSVASEAAVFPNLWVTLLNAKANFHKGYAQYLQARLVKASGGGEGEVFVGKFGLELGFLRGAISHMSQAEAGLVSLAWGISKLSDSDAEFVKRFRAEVSAILAEAKIVAEPAEKDNSMIYFETVPKDEDLPTVPAAILAKSDQSALAAFLSSYPSSKIIFADIPSLRTLKIQEKYDTCFTERIQPVLDSATEATAKCLETLAAWDLPLAVEMARLSNAEFVTKIMNNGSLLGSESSGAREMESIMREIAGRRDSTRISLQEAVSALDAEETEDSEMRMAFGIGKWTRLSSKDLNKGLRTAAASYLEKLEAANKSDEIVAQKVQANWERITTFVSSENNTKQILVERLNLVGNEDFSKNEILIKLQGALTLLNEILEKRKSAFAQIEDARKSAGERF